MYFSRLQTLSSRVSNQGFSLIELLITVGIVGIISAVAVPAYSDYVSRGKIAEALSQLSSLRLLTEQDFQDSRDYKAATNPCGGVVVVPSTASFLFVCTTPTAAGVATTYTWTAKNRTSTGLGASGDYQYAIDEDGNRTTAKYDGYASALSCWKATKSTSC